MFEGLIPQLAGEYVTWITPTVWTVQFVVGYRLSYS